MDRVIRSAIVLLALVVAVASASSLVDATAFRMADPEPWQNVYPLGGFEAELPPLVIAAARSYGDGLRTGLIYRCPEAAYSGNYGLRLLTGVRESIAVDFVASIQTASAVKISFMARTPAAPPPQDFHLYVGSARATDDAQTSGRPPVPGSPFTVTADWTEITFTFSEPSTARIALRFELGPNRHLMIDELRFEQRSTADVGSIEPTSD